MGQAATSEPRERAIAVLDMNGVRGVVKFEPGPQGSLAVKARLRGLSPGLHGFHIHEYGDLAAQDCVACGSHYNPRGSAHGDARTAPRHAGDLGNVEADPDGQVRYEVSLPRLKLRDVVGRSVVVHAGPDDLGQGRGAAREESLRTGNSGARLACGVIGWSS